MIYLFIVLAFHQVSSQLQLPKKLNRLSFGSCYGKQGKKNKIFDKIEQQNPEIFLWLGDAVYLDKLEYFQFKPNEKQIVMQIFDTYKNDPCYKDFKEKVPIIGVWDDHDYNINNGDITNPNKYWMQELFLDFLDEPKDSIRRTNQGIYTSYQFENVKMILLDVRFNKVGTDILGENQWEWLEQQLNNNDASKYTFIASGTQILPSERPVIETWDLGSKKRLFKLIKQSKREGVVFLSGDVHMAEFMKTPYPQYDMEYDIYEFTSSGMTHTSRDLKAHHVAELIFPETYQISQNYTKIHEKNFGIIDVYDDKLIWKIIDVFGETVQQLEIDYDQISKNYKLPITEKDEYLIDFYINYRSPEIYDLILMNLRNVIQKKSQFFLIAIILINIILIIRYLFKIVFQKLFRFKVKYD